jgi:uncharacterized protein (TIGR03435 family)
VYTLVVAKGGPKLTPAKSDEDAPPVFTKPGADGAGGSPAALNPGAGGATPPRGVLAHASPQGMTMEGHDESMEMFAEMISQQIGSTVVDKTGLTGKYDFTLSFMPYPGTGPISGPMMMRAPGGGPPGDGGAQTQDAPGPSLFAALPDQLGLKLQSQKAPVDVIVIDHIEQPSAN